MSLKIAIGGKGGVGKTTITALLARCLAADKNNKVIAIDADPVANLAAGLGIPEDKPITPISELTELIAERTGATPGTMGGFFTLNPKVDDIPDRFSLAKRWGEIVGHGNRAKWWFRLHLPGKYNPESIDESSGVGSG